MKLIYVMNWLYYLLLHYQTWIQYWIVLISWFGHVVSPRLIAVSPRFQLRSRILRQKLRWFNSNKRKKLKKPKKSKANAQWFQMAETRQKKITYSDFTNFSNKVSSNSLNFRFRSLQVLYFQNMSKWCSHMYNQSVSRVF